MFIGKAAQLSGTTIKAIRHYEAIGLLPTPQREGRYRVYSTQSVERLMVIKCAQQLGFKLKELQAILQGHQGDALPWAREPGDCSQARGAGAADGGTAEDAGGAGRV
jgi:MerR family transcriptional regulator, copper efflux regulator